jgi:hypothetical protein
MCNKLENELASSVPDGMSVVSAAFPAREILRSISAPAMQKHWHRRKSEFRFQSYFEKLKNIETGLRGFLQNCVQGRKGCAKRQAKPASGQGH